MALSSILKHDRLIVAAAIGGATLLAWGYILIGAGTGMPALDMSGLPTALGTMAFMQPAAWSWGYALVMIAMWWLMMVGMMLPSAAPMILLYAALARSRQAGGLVAGPVAAFAAAYLAVWGLFSIAAVALQWTLERAALLSPSMVVSSAALGAVLLAAAGLWQLVPAKAACLVRCRSPIAFLGRHWQPGVAGAWRIGARHGAFCLGCCWALMLLLFFGGVMNLYWIAGLTLLVLVEKAAPAGPVIGRIAGLLLLAGAAWIAVSLFVRG